MFYELRMSPFVQKWPLPYDDRNFALLCPESMNDTKPILKFDPFTGDGSRLEANYFTVGQRLRHTLLGLGLLAYGGWGVYVNDLHIPGKRSNGIHFHGYPAWAMFASIACAAAVLLALVVDHYDRRHNEHHYEWFKRRATAAGWWFFTMAIVWQFANLLRR